MKKTVPVLTLLALVAAASPTSAQLVALDGLSKIVFVPGAVVATDIAYDPVNNVYLTVSAYGTVWGAFANATGDPLSIPGTVPVTAGFRIGAADGSDAAHASYPNVIYSPDLAGGGGFLVAWLQSGYVYSAIVRYPGTVTAVNLVSTAAQGGAYGTIRPAIAYSRTSKRFLIAWTTNVWGILARFVDVSGAPTGDVVSLVDAGEARDPGLGWNPATDEFGLSYATHSAAIILKRVRASDGSVLSAVPIGYGHYGGDAVQVNAANQFVVGWNRDSRAGGGVYGAVIDQNGSVVASDRLLSSRMGTAYATSLAYNSLSGTFLAVSQDNGGTVDAVGVELNSDGTPKGLAIGLTSGATNGSFIPQVAASTNSKQFDIVFSRDYSGMANHIVSTGSASTGTPLPSCTFTVSTPPANFGPASTTMTVSVTASESTCTWSSSSGSAWVSLTSGAQGTGNGSATFSVAGNLTDSMRTGSITVAGRTFSFTQSGGYTAAALDLNTDGLGDVLWQNDSTGQIAAWLMDGNNRIGTLFLTPTVPDTGWKIVGTYDMNRDGSADLVWQHQDGWVAVWYMRGSTMLSGDLITSSPVDPAWRIVGTADMDSDGYGDLIWQHQNGAFAVWYMRGGQLRSGELIGQLSDSSWRIVAVADMDRDNRADFVWRHATSGQVAVWFMSDRRMLSAALVNFSVADSNWKIVGKGDFNRDGWIDLVWWNSATGQTATWYMQRATMIDGVWLNPTDPRVSDTSWRIVGPR